MYLGSKADKSVATEMEFAEILTPIEAIRNASAQKKAAALPAKLTVPMIVFFLPVLFLVILGPAYIKFTEMQN